MLSLRSVLNREDLTLINARLDAAAWADGRETAFGATRNGELRLKMPAGDAVVYPATTMHRVEPVTAGTRRVALTWIQSLITTAEHRELLFEMRQAIARLRERDAENEDLIRLNVVYQNFARLLSG